MPPAKGYKQSPEHIANSAASHRGLARSAEQKQRMAESHLGQAPWNKGIKTGVKPWLGKQRLDMRGDKHWFWKGGVTPENIRLRLSLEYRLWREAVLKKNDFTCQICGKRGGTLEADHIKPFSLFPDLRFDVSNGRTLCKKCHRATDTFGVKIRSYWSEMKEKIPA